MNLLALGKTLHQVYYNDTSEGLPPAGYSHILNHSRLFQLCEFANKSGVSLSIGLSAGPGSRGSNGSWTPYNAREFLAAAVSMNCRISHLELSNEPNVFAFIFGPEHALSPRQVRFTLRHFRLA